MAELDLIPPYDTKASAAGRRGANATRTKKQGPCNAAATRQPAVLSVLSQIKGLLFCIFLRFSSLVVPVTSASRLPGLELAGI